MISLHDELPDHPGIHRRELLRLGGLGLLGLGLPHLLNNQAQANRTPPGRVRARSCLLIYLEGGPSHIDLFDMKPLAPANVRGEFQPLRTSVLGLHLGEVLPRLTQQMHHFTLVRSVTHRVTDHNAGTYYTLTGQWPFEGSRLIVADGPRNFPNFGGVVAKLRPIEQPLPTFVHLPEILSNNNVNIAGQSAGFLGGRYDPFVAGDPSLPGYEPPGMQPRTDLPPARTQLRMGLVRELDRRLGQLRDDPGLERMTGFYRQALELVCSPQARQAFDLSREPRSVRERYGVDPGSDRSLEARQFGGLPQFGQCCLLARRLLEAGVRLVTVTTGRRYCQAWDTHRQHFDLLRRSICPQFDQGLSALMEDLSQRGLLRDTLVVALGEFGRTPRLGYVTSGAGAAANGRDHWPHCYTVLFAGAGVPGGAIHGASDRQGAYPSRDPVTPADVAATIYEILGIPAGTEIRDAQDRPHNLIVGRPIRTLLG